MRLAIACSFIGFFLGIIISGSMAQKTVSMVFLLVWLFAVIIPWEKIPR